MLVPRLTYAESKHRGHLWFPEQPPGKVEYFQHSFEGYALEGRILRNNSGENPWILSVHGARADFTKSDAVSFGLQKRGYSLLGMNMSGHSQAGVLEPENTTLGNNVRETEAFYQYLTDSRKKTIIAYSIGGTPALKLLESHSSMIDKFVLFYPGIYSRRAYEKYFGQDFREVISRPFSYRENDTIDLLERFRGKVLLIKGEFDGLSPEAFGKASGGSAGEVEIHGEKYYSPIPKEVIDMVYRAIPEDRRTLVEVPNCGHSVSVWMRDHPAQAESLLEKIDFFLRS